MKRIYITGCLLVLLAGALPVFAESNALTLEESIRLALTNNEQIQMAASGVTEAEWQVKKAKGEKSIKLDATHTTAKIGGQYWSVYHIDDVPSDYFINSLTATLPLYSGGRVENTLKQAQAGREISALALQNTGQEIAFQTIGAYYYLLSCRHMEQVRQEANEQLAGHLKQVEAQYAVGNVNRADVLRAEVELSDARQALVNAQNDTRKAVFALNKLMGVAIGQDTVIEDQFTYEQNDYQLPEAVSYALAHHPEQLIEVEAMEQARLGVELAKAGKRPDVSLDASYTTYDTKLDQFDTKQWMAGITAHLNVFDGQVTSAGVKAAEQKVEQARHHAGEVARTVELQVQSAFLDMKKAEQNMATNQTAVAKAVEDFKLSQLRYGVSLATNLDVMDAQVALTTAKTNYIRSIYEYNVSKAALERAMGKPVNLPEKEK